MSKQPSAPATGRSSARPYPAPDPGAGEIVYSCHLDHERPGANDNGSGCVTILESARILQHLIDSGQLARPKRTLRFTWGPEVEGTMAFLASHPEIKQRVRANIHMDMVGGDPFKNKSIFHVTATPWSLPSFVTDVGSAFLDTIRTAASGYAAGEIPAEEGIVETRAGASGTRNELIADVTPYSSGSDHDDYDSSTIAVPSLYLRDWPDIYIHTDHDTLDQIDATKLRRVALLGSCLWIRLCQPEHAATAYSAPVSDCASGNSPRPILRHRPAVGRRS
jgi:aminopeptidase YwaD